MKFPTLGKITVKVDGFVRGGVITDCEPSKVAGLVENGGTPKFGRGSVAGRKVTVWASSASHRQVMLSPA